MSNSDNIDMYRLIAEVQKHPIIWDRTWPTYKERLPTNIAWEEICSTLREDFHTSKESVKDNLVRLVSKKWVNARDNWMKWNRRESFLRKHPNRKAGNRRPYLYHEVLNFLKRNVEYNVLEAPIATIPRQSDEDGANHSENIYTAPVIPQKNERNIPITVTPTQNDTQYIALLEKEVQERSKRHLCFFKGILPSIANLSEHDTLEFQIGVLNLIKSVRTTSEMEDVPVSYVFNHGSSGDEEESSAKRIKREISVETSDVNITYQQEDDDMSE